MGRRLFPFVRSAYAHLFILLASWRAGVAVTLLVLASLAGVSFIQRESASALPPCPCNAFTTPTGQSEFSDGSDVELGFKFSADISGYITGVKFYKQGAMSGIHTGTLWESDGTPLESAVFSSETASGWQEVTFDSPVAITAGTTYVASVTMTDGRYVASGNYFTSEITNFPLRVPTSASSGGNGIFNATGGAFPTGSFNATNYWIDVSFQGNLGMTAPTVDATAPAADATDVNPGETISATFDDAMNQSTLTTSTFEVRDSGGALVPGTVSYSNTTKTASFAADEGFTTSETYTATLIGGSGTVVQNLEGVALAADYSWSFTIAETSECPCSLQERANPAGASTFDEATSVELGTKIVPQANGYITKVRFYKPIVSTDSTHDVHVWNSTGSSLATATSSNETDYGWQEVELGSPLRVTKGQLYIVSYSSASGIYVASANYHSSDVSNASLISYASGSAQNAATGSNNSNGVFRTTAGLYPNVGSGTATYYWIDAVFSTTSTPADPPQVEVTQPVANSYGIDRSKPIQATFNHALEGSTITGSTVRLFDSGNNQVSGTPSYDTATHSIVFTPDSPLNYSERYTARLSASIEDTDGETLGGEYSWSFTVGKEALTDINTGPGGPILVITDVSNNKYSPYYAEILRAEGLNYFATEDIDDVTASMLDNYAAVILAQMPLTTGQVNMLTSWVTDDGGNLVAMRPDKQLATLLGLIDESSTRTNQYMLIDTSDAPGEGLTSETIQYKTAADNYSLDGATAVATLYSDASTATDNPAVTTRSVGTNGGTAAAFTYDLAKSSIALRQGNQAWAGDNRDGNAPVRSNDMFFGAKTGDVQPDWVDLNKIHIPQADMQHQLLSNILIEATKDAQPLPRFWYLPHDYKAAMVMAGDDHNLSNIVGTEKVFNNWLNESPTNCALARWECVRASGYVYENSSLSASRALQYHGLGFEVANHVPNDDIACQDFTSYANLTTIFNTALTDWRSKHSSLPNQRTNRYHCYVWSDWDSMARVEHDNDIRYDLNYATFPSSWIGTRPAILTGSAMNMRFTDADGDMMDVYQGVTNFENTVTGSAAIASVLASATGSDEYYGIYGTHYDMSDNYHQTLFTQAQAADVPIISSDQALTWLDGRGSSKFSNFAGGNGEFGFDIAPGMGAEGLRAMMPIEDAGGTLQSATRNGSVLSYQTRTVKGVQYAVFDASPGSYEFTYSDVSTDPDPDPDPDPGEDDGDNGSGDNDGGTPTTPPKNDAEGGSGGAIDDTPDENDGETGTPDPNEDPGEEDPNNGPATDPKNETKDEKNEGASWLLWLGGIVLVAAVGGFWLFFWRRRKRPVTFE